MRLADDTDVDALLQGALRLLRLHLDLDVALVAQLVDDRCVYRCVDADDDSPLTGDTTQPLADAYGHQVVTGGLPPLVRDATAHPTAAGLPLTHALPIGTHLGVPLVLRDGSTYGALCAFSHHVDDGLGEEALDVLRTVASMLSGLLEAAEATRRQAEQRRTRLRRLTVAGGLELELAFQPIVALETGEVVGVEALARFPDLEESIPGVFADAWQLGIGLDLELRAAAAALEELTDLPEELYLTINVGPDALESDELVELVRRSAPARVVVEIAEQHAIDEDARLLAAVERLAATGARLAIDDVGTAFTSLDHLLRLQPHTLKLDGALIEGIDASPAQQAMVSALLSFADRLGATVVAERIETAEELATVRTLGVVYGQGYHLGHPGQLAGALAPAAPRPQPAS